VCIAASADTIELLAPGLRGRVTIVNEHRVPHIYDIAHSQLLGPGLWIDSSQMSISLMRQMILNFVEQ
jgi:hypothetical protein